MRSPGRQRTRGRCARGGTMNGKIIAYALAVSLTVAGCPPRPREFTPTLAAPAGNQSAFDAAYVTCRQLLVEGKLDASGRSGSAGAAAAAGGNNPAARAPPPTGGGGAGPCAGGGPPFLVSFSVCWGGCGGGQKKSG